MPGVSQRWTSSASGAAHLRRAVRTPSWQPSGSTCRRSPMRAGAPECSGTGRISKPGTSASICAPAGAYDTVEAIRETRIQAGGRELPHRRYRQRGTGLCPSRRRGLPLSEAELPGPGRVDGQGRHHRPGRNLKSATARIQGRCRLVSISPAGVQPARAVTRSIDEFYREVAGRGGDHRAGGVLLLLGLRTRLVVALSRSPSCWR